MAALKVTAIGSEMGVVIPPDMLAQMRVNQGDTLFAVEMAGGYFLSAHDPKVARQIAMGLEFMETHHETFKRLAR